ncbi:MAG: bifunctional 5,10-methylenetetrahydrofolate dehydrogenase/5,10-methenyltetrahydrofolate cyclohydrolase [Dehalococcoidia bacterium]|nr:bifunctional 5,10-methylenetetrahydrofolate dehydrogenase/5,10-methenyltetrahydrofolate cyclohydrolase [Dehalococcoidia bacterium]MYA61859.1 bifunctional 5,10-methylenetetrahydrofolate dehydrogenase/5,10-methenyltetrahydrofolate cyclohydrolase [Dehalococcoidia bacterium]
MSATIIRGTPMAEEIREEVAEGVAEMRSKHGIVPGLAVVLVGDDPASSVYVRNKERAAVEAGMVSEIIRMSTATEEEVLSAVGRLNSDARIHGTLVQLPLPDHISENKIIESINPNKDVDGLHPFNMGLLMAGRPRFIPATPGGIQQMLIRTGFDPSGKNVVVLGRSNIVGKPIANLLMQRSDGANATVTVCHTRTRNLEEITRDADIIIAAIGQPRYLKADMVKEGVVVIDVGINQIDAPERRRGYRLVGDVDYRAVREKAAAITPVPGGVGPMTIAMLLSNTLKAARLFMHPHLRDESQG